MADCRDRGNDRRRTPVSPDQLRSRRRCSQRIATARQVATYLARTRLELPYAAIGTAFGRDRTTVAHACRLVEELREGAAFDPAIARMEQILDARLVRCGALVA